MANEGWMVTLFYALLIALLLGSGCRPAENNQQRNVILITLDTQRADHIGALGDQKAHTPHIDGFAHRGIVYENAFSPIPITLPAHAALFFSLPPHSLQVYNNGQIFTSPESPSLAEIFHRRGFLTAAFVSLGVLKARFKLDEGFETYWDRQHPRRWYRTAGEVNDRVIPWLQGNYDRRFFLWIHYSDPHDPYAPPSLPPDLRVWHNDAVHREICVRRREDLRLEFLLHPGDNHITFECLLPFPIARQDYRISFNDIAFQNSEHLEIFLEGGDWLTRGGSRILAFTDKAVLRIVNPGPARELIMSTQGNINLFPSEQADGYRQEVEYLDSEIGRLTQTLQSLGLLENTVVVLVGDHGEGLGDYYGPNNEVYFGHIHYLRDVYLRIPLIVYDPASRMASSRIADPVSLMDVAPTLLRKMGWRVPRSHTGRPLPDSGYTPDRNRLLFEETYSPEAFTDRFGGRRASWHLIYTPAQKSIRLFRPGVDPAETVDVYPQFRQDPEVRKLTDEVVRRARKIRASKPVVRLDEESRRMLKSLGYIR